MELLGLMRRGYQPFNGNKIAYYTHLDKVKYIKQSKAEETYLINPVAFKVCRKMLKSNQRFCFLIFSLKIQQKIYQKAIKV